jgi:hypothetical protein
MHATVSQCVCCIFLPFVLIAPHALASGAALRLRAGGHEAHAGHGEAVKAESRLPGCEKGVKFG